MDRCAVVEAYREDGDNVPLASKLQSRSEERAKEVDLDEDDDQRDRPSDEKKSPWDAKLTHADLSTDDYSQKGIATTEEGTSVCC